MNRGVFATGVFQEERRKKGYVGSAQRAGEVKRGPTEYKQGRGPSNRPFGKKDKENQKAPLEYSPKPLKNGNRGPKGWFTKKENSPKTRSRMPYARREGSKAGNRRAGLGSDRKKKRVSGIPGPRGPSLKKKDQIYLPSGSRFQGTT